jgi:hypothetical protein
MEDFSLIILCKKGNHLLPSTLDTLKPQNGSFEVLLLDGEGIGRFKDLVDSYPELKLRILNVRGCNLGEMMNEGLGLSRGKYIQFLEPGDRYISQHGLEFLSTLIEKQPHLVYANSLNRGAMSPTDFLSARSPWFLKSKIFELGGFDPRLSTCPTMDILCRLFLDQKAETLFCNRVLVQSELSSPLPLRETCKILYRYFGVWRTLKRLFSQNRPQLIQRATTFIKEAFWRNEN